MSTETKVVTRSIFIEGREWFDRSGGNSYWSARVWGDGEILFTLEMRYGYGDSYVHESVRSLRDAGLLPEGWEENLAVSSNARNLGIDFYQSIKSVNKRELFKRHQ